MMYHGVKFTAHQLAAISKGHPKWELNPPQRETFSTDHDYAVALHLYALRVIQSKQSFHNEKQS